MGEDGEEEGGEGERKEETKVSRPWKGDRGGEGVRRRKGEKRQEHSNLGGLMHWCSLSKCEHRILYSTFLEPLC